MTITEAKDELIKFVLSQEGFPQDEETKYSVHRLVHKDQFIIDGEGQNLTKFLTWEHKMIDGDLHIFVNNLFIHPSKRNRTSLLDIRGFLRALYPNARKFYWFNREKQVLRYRR